MRLCISCFLQGLDIAGDNVRLLRSLPTSRWGITNFFSSSSRLFLFI